MVTKKTEQDATKKTDQPATLYEVLTEAANGHRTVHRVTAASETAAQCAVADTLEHGARVLGVAPPGRGLGSGDTTG